MIKKYDRVVGIDPDVDKSGVTELHIASKRLNVTSLTFPLLIDYLKYVKEKFVDEQGESVVIVVEAGWMNESNWHITSRTSVRIAAKVGQNTGRNHETARKIVEMAKHIGFVVDEIKPLKKCWRGKDGKVTHEELSYIVGGLDKRTSQDARDSCLIAWCYAGLPIKVKPISNK